VHERAIAGGFEHVVRELVVLELQLLQSDDVGLAIAQPREQQIETGAQAVDVPGRDAHGGRE
jgi:hypothetical protein